MNKRTMKKGALTEMRISMRSRNRLLTLLLAFAMVFTGMGIGSWEK